MNRSWMSLNVSSLILCSVFILSTAVYAAAPNIGSGLTTNQGKTVSVGQTVQFIIGAFDSDGDSLTYVFTFGDGQSINAGTNPFAAHTYAAVGTYIASVSVSDNTSTVVSAIGIKVVAPLVGTGLDSDGDGFSDGFETELGTNNLSINSTPLSNVLASNELIQPFGVTKKSVKLNFASSNSDSLSLAGDLYSGGALSPLGKVVKVDIGGIVRTFTLDSKGMGTVGTTSVFKINGKFGITNIGVAQSVYKFQISIQKSALASFLTGEGFANTSVTKSVTLPVVVLFNGKIYQQNVVLAYVGIAGKSGTAK